VKRIAGSWLSGWRQRTDRKPLLVRGARQVGKTHTIKAFGKSSFEELVTVDFERDRRTQRELAATYRMDFAKYAPRSDPRCLEAVFESAAATVGQQTKYTRLAQGFSGPTIRRAFDLLSKARVISRVPAALPRLPFGASGSARRFKTLMVDIGLAQSILGTRYESMLEPERLLEVHRGAMAEQLVGQELSVSQGASVFYWARQARGSSAEVDYLAAVDGQVVPIEIKSGPAGRLKSLHMLLADNRSIPYGLVLSTARYAELPERRLRFVPLYHALGATLGEAGIKGLGG